MTDLLPRVALESSVIAHGLPHPHNLEAERLMCGAIERGNAEPSMIALVDGQLKSGLTHEEVTRLASESHVEKVSTKDIARVMASGRLGATTVASTIWCANRLGIEVIATGGIGGIHRGNPFDVSADIITLGSTPVTLVCSGAKTILDLPATREALESHGVTVIGYQTDSFPAFYSPASNLSVDTSCQHIDEIAHIVRARDNLGITSAILVCVPVPEDAGLSADELETLIEAAYRSAEMADVSSSALTPYLLAYLSQHSDGRTLAANLALLENNASVAAAIARALTPNAGE